MNYDISKIKWYVYVTVNLDMKIMWIATPPPEEGIQLNMAGCNYFDKKNPKNGIKMAEEGWKEFAKINKISKYEIEIVEDTSKDREREIEEIDIIEEKG